MSNGRLVLTRRSGETLTITVGDQIFEIGVISIDKNQARLFIEADEEVKVVRTELLYELNS